MAYSAPPQWVHLDYPTAAKLNLYKSGLDAIYAQTSSVQVNGAVCRRIGTVQGYYFVNIHRWLLYLGAGRIDDPAEMGEEVSLSDAGGWNMYDLTQVDWIYPGKLYQVQAVTSCLEHFKGL